jgi:hypothetical protein
MISKLMKAADEDDDEDGWAYAVLSAFVQENENEHTLLHELEDYVINNQSKLINASLFRVILQILYDSGKFSVLIF